MKWFTVLAPAALLLGAPMLPPAARMGTAEAQVVHTATGCNNCHRLHGSPGPQLLLDAVLEDLCLSCHNDGSPFPGAPPGPFDVHNGLLHSSPTSCADCHGHRGDAGSNLSLIRAAIPADTGGAAFVDLPVVFTSRGTDAGQASLHSFADGDEDADGDYDGVCEVCHTNTGNHRNGFDLPSNPDNSNHAHERGRTCSDCHTHESGFGGGGPCSACHDTGGDGTQGPNNRRAIIPEFSRASHHVVWADSVPSSDCQACHDQSGHQQGIVRLWNVDFPADTSETFNLAADPFTNPTEAALVELFCLACHDPAGAGPSQPFSDLNTPPLVDSTAWIASSHHAVGSYTCLDCHGSAHGSEKQNLLAPANVAPTPPANAEEEEGFCFDCHDADGPSTINIQGVLDDAINPIRWVADDAGVNANLNLNDRHDVQYAAANTSGARIECANCHDPHAAVNVAGDTLSLLRRDPDPADGRSPESDNVFAGMDILSQWCLDCHDGSFPATVTDQTTPIVNILDAWQNIDQMGAQSTANDALKTGTGWDTWPDPTPMPCLSCHAPHGREGSTQRTNRNLFQLKDIVHEPDGVTPVPSDGGPGYMLIDNSNRDDNLKGYDWCNTCHISSMGGGQRNCFNCHNHSDGRF